MDDKLIEQMIENDIDDAIELAHNAREKQLDFDTEMENAEDPCCEECGYYSQLEGV